VHRSKQSGRTLAHRPLRLKQVWSGLAWRAVGSVRPLAPCATLPQQLDGRRAGKAYRPRSGATGRPRRSGGPGALPAARLGSLSEAAATSPGPRSAAQERAGISSRSLAFRVFARRYAWLIIRVTRDRSVGRHSEARTSRRARHSRRQTGPRRQSPRVRWLRERGPDPARCQFSRCLICRDDPTTPRSAPASVKTQGGAPALQHDILRNMRHRKACTNGELPLRRSKRRSWFRSQRACF
jgi:hypothetical protein